MEKIIILIFLISGSLVFAQQPKSYSIAHQNKWGKKKLSVCWRAQVLEDKNTDLNLSKPLKNYIRDIKEIVQDQFRLESTGITFVGWNRCRGLSFLYDVKLNLYAQSAQTQSSIQASATVGANTDERSNVEIVYKYSPYAGWKKKLSHSDHFKAVALHEFAHIAGLDHQKDGSDPKKPYDIDKDYDRISIMSYKYLQYLETNGLKEKQSKVVLSHGDLNALRCLYVYDHNEVNELCMNNVVTIH